MNKTHMF